MCYTLPKIWTGRIQEYWDRILPSNIPASDSKFDVKFNSDEETAAVKTFEDQLGTSESVVAALLPNNTVVSNYYGTYEVTAVPGVLTLLFPEKVNSEAVIVMHYDADTNTWTKVENTQLIDGYIWGTLDSFSPISVVAYKKEIHYESSVANLTAPGGVVVCEGNAVKVSYDATTGKTFVTNPATGKQFELNAKTTIVGGSVDGSAVESTSISISGLLNNAAAAKIISGSFYVPEDKTKFTTVGSIYVYCDGPVLGCLTGSMGAVRTENVVYDLHDCIAAWLGAGEGFKNLNVPGTKLASTSTAKNVNMVLDNVKCTLTYIAQNCEYFYTEKAYAKVTGGTHQYLLACSSNDATGEVEVYCENANITYFQNNNRGLVESSKATFTNCNVTNLFIGGDATDSTVTGTNNNIRLEINAGSGTYNIKRGTIGGTAMTAAQIQSIVDCVKVSRNAGTVTIADDLVADLGTKYIIK